MLTNKQQIYHFHLSHSKIGVALFIVTFIYLQHIGINTVRNVKKGIVFKGPLSMQ